MERVTVLGNATWEAGVASACREGLGACLSQQEMEAFSLTNPGDSVLLTTEMAGNPSTG